MAIVCQSPQLWAGSAKSLINANQCMDLFLCMLSSRSDTRLVSRDVRRIVELTDVTVKREARVLRSRAALPQIASLPRVSGLFPPGPPHIKTVMPRAGRPTWYRDQGDDLDIETGLLPYDLARKSASHTNDALKLANQRRAPLIYFRAVRSALYEAIWPVWVEEFRADEGRVLLAAANPAREDAVPDEWPRPNTSIGDRERSYSLRMTRRRNHQAWFSRQVRSVYGYRCAFSP